MGRRFEDKEQDLRNRYENWTDKSISQLSFFNNLLLAISVGLVTLVFKDMDISGVEFTFHKINYSITCLRISLVIFTISIFIGLFVALSRLYDFRLTRRICYIKYKYFKRTKNELKSTKTRGEYKLLKRIIMLITLPFTDKRINDADFDDFIISRIDDGFEKFDTLREITYNLGIGTWNMLNWQICTFILGMILFLIGFLMK